MRMMPRRNDPIREDNGNDRYRGNSENRLTLKRAVGLVYSGAERRSAGAPERRSAGAPERRAPSAERRAHSPWVPDLLRTAGHATGGFSASVPACLAVAVFAFAAAPQYAHAQTEVAADWALIPSGLGAGDQFRLLVVTSTARDATSSNIGDYDTHVQTAVASGHTAIQSYSSEFKALASTGAVDARDHTSTRYTGDTTSSTTDDSNLGVPIYYLGGAKVADDYRDLYDGNWDSQTPRNESGKHPSGNRVRGLAPIATERRAPIGLASSMLLLGWAHLEMQG